MRTAIITSALLLALKSPVLGGYEDWNYARFQSEIVTQCLQYFAVPETEQECRRMQKAALDDVLYYMKQNETAFKECVPEDWNPRGDFLPWAGCIRSKLPPPATGSSHSKK